MLSCVVTLSAQPPQATQCPLSFVLLLRSFAREKTTTYFFSLASALFAHFTRVCTGSESFPFWSSHLGERVANRGGKRPSDALLFPAVHGVGGEIAFVLGADRRRVHFHRLPHALKH